MNNKMVHMVAFILLIVGGLNWLLVGIWEIDLVNQIFKDSIIAKIIYILVGLSAVYELLTHKRNCKDCTTAAPSTSM